MQNRIQEFIVKEVSRPKLTIAKDRVTIKVPIGTSEDEISKIKEFSCLIEKFHAEEFELTMRGVFNFYGNRLTIQMNGGHKKKGQSKYPISQSFNFEKLQEMEKNS